MLVSALLRQFDIAGQRKNIHVICTCWETGLFLKLVPIIYIFSDNVFTLSMYKGNNSHLKLYFIYDLIIQ